MQTLKVCQLTQVYCNRIVILDAAKVIYCMEGINFMIKANIHFDKCRVADELCSYIRPETVTKAVRGNIQSSLICCLSHYRNSHFKKEIHGKLAENIRI